MKIRWPNTALDYIEWIGTITGLMGALIVSSNMGYVGVGYIIFLISALCVLYVGVVLRRWGIFTMSLGYSLINLWGIWRWLIWPLIGQ